MNDICWNKKTKQVQNLRGGLTAQMETKEDKEKRSPFLQPRQNCKHRSRSWNKEGKEP